MTFASWKYARERTREKKRGACRDLRKPLGEPAASRPPLLGPLELGHTANLSDEVQEVLTLDAGQLFAEQ